MWKYMFAAESGGNTEDILMCWSNILASLISRHLSNLLIILEHLELINESKGIPGGSFWLFPPVHIHLNSH